MSAVLANKQQKQQQPDAAFNLTTDTSAFGKILMGQGDGGDAALLVVHNPLGETVTEAISVQVPVCNVAVSEYAPGGADGGHEGAAVSSQVTAMFGISDGEAPYYDFSLQFVATIPPLSHKAFVVSPSPDSGCHGGDLAAAAASRFNSTRVVPRSPFWIAHCTHHKGRTHSSGLHPAHCRPPTNAPHCDYYAVYKQSVLVIS